MTSNKDIIKGLKQAYHSIKIDPASIEHNRAKILAAYKEQFPSQHKDLFFYFRPIGVTVIALFVFLAASGGLVAFAQNALPGSQLYGLKRVYEKTVMALMPASRKPALRAEIVTRRLGDVQYLIGSEKENVPSLSLQAATKELEKEIIALRKELSGEDNKNVQGPDLPVMDNQKIIAAVNNKNIDLAKILSDTKEAIKDNNIKMAVDKLGDLEKIFSATADESNQNDQTQEVVNSDNQKNEIENISPEKDNQKKDGTSVTSENQITPTPVIKKVPLDFKVDVNLETEKETP